MITKDEISKFFTNDFKKALLVGKQNNEQIELKLQLKGQSNNYYETDNYKISYEKLEQNPNKLLEFLFSNYLKNNMIIGVEYFSKIKNNEDKICFTITSIDNKFVIAIEKNILSILPVNFIDRLEATKRKDILRWINENEIELFYVDNFNQEPDKLHKSGLAGIFREYFIYEVLKIKDKKGNIRIYDEEYEFVKKIFQVLINKGKPNIKELNKIKIMIDNGKISYWKGFQLNNKVNLNLSDLDNIDIFEILNEVISEFIDNNNQEKTKVLKKER